MTDRHAAYIVTLDEDIRKDDAEAIINALRMVKHIIAVEPVVADFALGIAERRASNEWRKRIYNMLDEADKEETRD